jgi:hypothetical protein
MRPLTASAAPPKSATAKLLDREPGGAEFHVHVGLLRLHAGDEPRPILSDSAPSRGQSKAAPPSIPLARS